MKNIFKDTVIIVTGGASGIGQSLTDQLSALGAYIVIADTNSKKGKQQAKRIADRGNHSAFKKVDLAHVKDAENFFRSVVKEYGHIDYVFNGAGIFMAGEIRDTPLENWHKVLENNIFAVFNGSHFAYRQMLKQGSGHIVNFASAAGLFPVPEMSIYGASKFAIVGLTHGLRNEAKSLGIKASVVCPTIVDTPLYDTALYNNLDSAKALKARSTLQKPDLAAKRIIKSVSKNRATIHTAFSTRVAWWAYKFVPGIYGLFARRVITLYRSKLRIKNEG